MPLTMSRVVRLRTGSGEWIPDPNWHGDVRETLFSLLQFFASRNLLAAAGDVLAKDFDQLVLRQADLTDQGIALIRTGAVDRWLGSFDKRPTKSKADYSILDKALRNAAGSAQPITQADAVDAARLEAPGRS
jgi:hypothetical protein